MDLGFTMQDRRANPFPSREGAAKETSAPASDLPLVSVIVVNYNGKDVLPKCLSALSKLDYPNCEIIIVDNGSTDGSAEFAEDFSSRFSQHVLRFPTNRGLAVARNAGVKLGKGSYYAFIDNDGFPETNWLSVVVETFLSKPNVGAVASLVLFDRRPDIVNGIGGGLSDRGIGFDFLYHRPEGFHSLPEEITYPMGCGMVVRREAAAKIFPIDEKLVNYYDDVEVGIRTWRSGYRVEICPAARVKHAFNHSSLKNPINKEILCHRNRLRTALKYWPLMKLPKFISNEFMALTNFMWINRNGFSSIFLWNLRYLGSALSIRATYPLSSHRGPVPKSSPKELKLYPNNADFLPDWENILEVVDMEASCHPAALNFGWYYLESIDNTPFRYTTDVASAFLRTDQATNSFLLRYVLYTDESFTVEILDKTGKEVAYSWELSGELFKFHSVRRPVALPPGDYQVLFRSDFARQPGCGRVLGVGVNFMGLWNVP